MGAKSSKDKGKKEDPVEYDEDFFNMQAASCRPDISKATKAEIFATFQEYDTDRNGYVSLEEAHDLLKDMFGFNRKQTVKMVALCDKNKDGKLSYNEFIDFYFRIKDKIADLTSAFHTFDANRDGYISLDEAKEALLNFGLEEDEIEALVNIYDENNDGRLQYEEFVKLWNAK